MLSVLEQALSWGGRQQADRLAGQGSIFDLGPPRRRGRSTIRRSRPRWRRTSSCGSRRRRSASTSPSTRFGGPRPLRRKCDCGLSELERRRDGEVVTVGGIVGALKQLTTKKGEPMVFMRLEDVTGGVEVVVFNSVYAARHLLETDRILVVKGRVDHKEGETKLIALELTEFEAARERKQVRLKLDARKAHAGLIRELAGVVREYPGEAPVFVDIISAGPKTLRLGPGYRVQQPVPDFFAEVKALLGEAAVI